MTISGCRIVYVVACLTLTVAQDQSSSPCALRERHNPPVKGHCPPGFFLHRHPRTSDNGETCRRRRVCRRCTACPPGVGAVRPCGRRADTVCEPCVPGTTYSDLTSYDQPCLRCTRCSRHARVERNCSVTHDARCHRCRKGYFFNSLTRECVPCSYCYPNHPGLTLPVRQCAVRGQSELYRCFPVVNPPLPPPTTTPPTARGSVEDRRGRRRRRRLRRRQQRAGRVAGRVARQRNGQTPSTVTTFRTSEPQTAANS